MVPKEIVYNFWFMKGNMSNQKTYYILGAATVFALIGIILGSIGFTKHNMDDAYDNLPSTVPSNMEDFAAYVKIAYIPGVIALTFGLVSLLLAGLTAYLTYQGKNVEALVYVTQSVATIVLILGVLSILFNTKAYNEAMDMAKGYFSSI